MEDVRQKKRKNWKSLIPRTLMGSLSISWKMSRSKCSLPFSIFNKVIKIDWKILFTVKVNTTGYGIILAMTCKIAVMLNDHFIYPLNHFVQITYPVRWYLLWLSISTLLEFTLFNISELLSKWAPTAKKNIF